MLGNDQQYSNTPWTYYQYIYQLPILGNQTSTNYERYTDAERLEPDAGLDRTPTTNTKAYQAHDDRSSQTTFLQDLPAIPLWYNGMWAMYNTKHWTNWPSSSGRQYTPRSLAELLPDDEHRHAHASCARERKRGAISDRRSTPPGHDPGGVLALERQAADGSRLTRYLARKALHLPRHVLGGGDDRLGDPALHAGRPDPAAPLADAGSAGTAEA